MTGFKWNLKIKCISWFQPMGDHTEHPFCGFDQSFVKMTTENMPCWTSMLSSYMFLVWYENVIHIIRFCINMFIYFCLMQLIVTWCYETFHLNWSGKGRGFKFYLTFGQQRILNMRRFYVLLLLSFFCKYHFRMF